MFRACRAQEENQIYSRLMILSQRPESSLYPVDLFYVQQSYCRQPPPRFVRGEPNHQPPPVLCYMYTKSSQGCLPRPQVKIPPTKVKENAEMPSRRLMVSRNVEREFGENTTGFCPSLDGSREQKGVIVEVECPGRGMKNVCVI